MKYSVPLMLFVILAFSGCTRTVYVDRKVEVNIPVPCIVPESKCATKAELADMNASAVVEATYQCVMLHEENEKVCK